MSPEFVGLLGFVALMALIFLGMPIGIAMAVVGAVGTWYLGGLPLIGFAVGTAPYEAVSPYAMSVLPLFVMMGVFAAHSGISRKLFGGANAVVGRLPGGLGMATVGSCAGFGAICGSSLATSATIARIAIPEMQRHNYDMRLAAGSVAAGGTLGIMIPPSLALAMYGILTQNSIGALYLAGILPGVLGMTLYAAAVAWVVIRDPKAGPPAPPMSWAERVRALLSIFDVAVLFALILGGMFGGFFSATEGAAIGVAGALLIAGYRGMLTRRSFLAGLRETASTISMLFMILVGARTFGFMIDLSGLPSAAVAWVDGLSWSPLAVLLLVLFVYLLLGCVMDGLAMMIITLPVVFPIIQTMGLDPIWFRILMVTVSEVGLISPPFGINLFVVQAVRPEISYRTMVSGILPFIGADIVRLGLLIGFPAISLVLLR